MLVTFVIDQVVSFLSF